MFLTNKNANYQAQISAKKETLKTSRTDSTILIPRSMLQHSMLAPIIVKIKNYSGKLCALEK